MKYHDNYLRLADNEVAPCVGAWVEIQACHLLRIAFKSPPAWGRGLKSFLSIF